MTLRRLLVVVAVVSVSLVCVRLGAWQLSRLAEKRALNVALRAALAAPPFVVGAALPPADSAVGRPVEFAGGLDERFHVLLRGRVRDGEPGVDVVTPFRLAGDSVAVLVERGWLAAADGASVEPSSIPADSSRSVIGIARAFEAGDPIPPLREIGNAERRVWSAPRLDRDSLAVRLPYRIAPYFVVALPGSGAPPSPARRAPREHDEATHLGYAIQWFAIAAIVPAGAVLLARRRRVARR